MAAGYGWIKGLLALLLYAGALLWGQAAQASMDVTHVALDTPLDAATAGTLQQQEAGEEAPVPFCFWGERPRQTVTCQETGAAAQVTQILLAGNPALLDAGVLTWQPGCQVDPETAQRLFGTSQCASQQLWYQGRAYPVLGTVSSLEPVMVFLGGPGDQLDRLVLALPPEEGSAQAPQCLLRWGLSGRVRDFFLYWSLVNNWLLLFPGIVALSLCARLAGRGQLPGKLAAAVCLAGALWLLSRQVLIPRDMIPSQWSDFAFWGRWWEAEKKNALEIFLTPLGSRQLQMCLDMVKSVLASTAACLLWPVRRKTHADTADRR